MLFTALFGGLSIQHNLTPLKCIFHTGFDTGTIMDSIQNDQFKNFTMVRQYDATDLSDGKNNYDEGYATIKQWLGRCLNLVLTSYQKKQ